MMRYKQYIRLPIISLSVAEGLKKINPKIKWSNDILEDNKKSQGSMVRRHFNEFFTFDKNGYVGIIIVGPTGDVNVYLPTWKETSLKTKEKITKAIKSSLGYEYLKVKFIILKLS